MFNKSHPIVRCVIVVVMLTAFMGSTLLPSQFVHAQVLFPNSLSMLPQPGVMVHPSPGFHPPVIRGIKIFPDDPLRFDFIIDTGDEKVSGDNLKGESGKLIKYFLASLTVPDDDIWVNLSPGENDRIIPDAFGITEMGKDLLAQDYLLKQLTASLMNPKEELGDKFWKRIRLEAVDRFGTTEIPIDAFNKVWIVPEHALVYESGDMAFVIESRLKVMLEVDYLAEQNNQALDTGYPPKAGTTQANLISKDFQSEIIRDIIVPAITKEVNEGKNFAPLRQIYHSLILATWFKRNLKESTLGKIYIDENKVAGVDIEDKEIKHKIYDRYMQALQQGVFNYIKEDYDPVAQQAIPRKYFSGGFGLGEPWHDSNVVKQESVSGSFAVAAAQDVSRRLVLAPTKLDAMSADKQTKILPDDALDDAANPEDSAMVSGQETAAQDTGPGERAIEKRDGRKQEIEFRLLRELNEQEAADVIEVLGDWTQPYEEGQKDPVFLSPRGISSWIKQRDNSNILLGYADGELAAAYGIQMSDQSNVAFARGFYVSPRYRRKGVGANAFLALLDYVIEKKQKEFYVRFESTDESQGIGSKIKRMLEARGVQFGFAPKEGDIGTLVIQMDGLKKTGILENGVVIEDIENTFSEETLEPDNASEKTDKEKIQELLNTEKFDDREFWSGIARIYHHQGQRVIDVASSVNTAPSLAFKDEGNLPLMFDVFPYPVGGAEVDSARGDALNLYEALLNNDPEYVKNKFDVMIFNDSLLHILYYAITIIKQGYGGAEERAIKQIVGEAEPGSPDFNKRVMDHLFKEARKVLNDNAKIYIVNNEAIIEEGMMIKGTAEITYPYGTDVYGRPKTLVNALKEHGFIDGEEFEGGGRTFTVATVDHAMLGDQGDVNVAKDTLIKNKDSKGVRTISKQKHFIVHKLEDDSWHVQEKDKSYDVVMVPATELIDPADKKQVKDLFSEIFSGTLIQRLMRDSFKKRRSNKTMVLLHQDEVVGVYSYNVTEKYLNGVVVRKDYQGEGFVHVLLEDLKNRFLNDSDDASFESYISRISSHSFPGKFNGTIEQFKERLGVLSIIGIVEDGVGLQNAKAPGGIDFNPQKIDLQTAGEGIEVTPAISFEQLEHMPIDGFVPVIIDIVPLTNLPLQLGVLDTEESKQGAVPSFDRDPADNRKALINQKENELLGV